MAKRYYYTKALPALYLMENFAVKFMCRYGDASYAEYELNRSTVCSHMMFGEPDAFRYYIQTDSVPTAFAQFSLNHENALDFLGLLPYTEETQDDG